jgi:hypothetical protein
MYRVNDDTHSMLLHVCRHGYGAYGERVLGMDDCLSLSDGASGVDFVLFKGQYGHVASFRMVETFTTLLELDWTPVHPEFFPGDCLVPAGILDIYLGLRDEVFDLLAEQVHEGRSVAVCGYSVGAALAAVASLDIAYSFGYNVRYLGYGSPVAGNTMFYRDLREKCLMVSNFFVADDPVRFFPFDGTKRSVSYVGRPEPRWCLYLSVVLRMIGNWLLRTPYASIGEDLVSDRSAMVRHEWYNYIACISRR